MSKKFCSYSIEKSIEGKKEERERERERKKERKKVNTLFNVCKSSSQIYINVKPIYKISLNEIIFNIME